MRPDLQSGLRTESVPGDLDGERLDKAVAALFSLSMAVARRLCADGRVVVASGPLAAGAVPRRRGSKGDRVATGDVVGVVGVVGLGEGGVQWFVDDGAPAIVILHEDADVVVVDKPAGVPCHPLSPGEGGTVVDGLVARFPEIVGASVETREAGLLHRLDTGTSGCLALARKRSTWERLRSAFVDVDKTYLAIVHGACAATVIDAALGKDGPDRMRLDPLGQPARTVVTPLSTSTTTTNSKTTNATKATTLVRLQLFGGRRHQLRVHLASIGHPLVGDVRYGGDDAGGAFFLHAWRLVLDDGDSPVDSTVDVTAPLPAAFTAELARLGLQPPTKPTKKPTTEPTTEPVRGQKRGKKSARL